MSSSASPSPVGLARALADDPRGVPADEPTGHLDATAAPDDGAVRMRRRVRLKSGEIVSDEH